VTATFNKKIFTLAILAIASTGLSAKADTFDFTFSNTRGTQAGTVTGEIFGLNNNATGPASEIIITSFPAALDSIFGSGAVIPTNWNVQLLNSFTVQNNIITSLIFRATDTVNGVTDTAQFYMQNDLAFLELNIGSNRYVYGDNLDPPPATPEPAYLVLTGLGLGGLVFLKLRRNAVRG
jgi:hypothetical protein